MSRKFVIDSVATGVDRGLREADDRKSKRFLFLRRLYGVFAFSSEVDSTSLITERYTWSIASQINLILSRYDTRRVEFPVLS